MSDLPELDFENMNTIFGNKSAQDDEPTPSVDFAETFAMPVGDLYNMDEPVSHEEPAIIQATITTEALAPKLEVLAANVVTEKVDLSSETFDVNPDAPTASRKAKIEARLGITLRSSREGVLARTQAALKECITVQLSSGQHRMTASLRASELGLTDIGVKSLVADKKLKLGSIEFLDRTTRKELNGCIQVVRAWVRNNCIALDHSRFLMDVTPDESGVSRFDTYSKLFAEQRAKFFELVNTVANDEYLANVKEQARKDFRPLATEAWKKTCHTWTEQDTQEVGYYAGSDTPTELFTNHYLTVLVAKIPTAAEVVNKAYFDQYLGFLHTPEANILEGNLLGCPAAKQAVGNDIAKRAQSMVNDIFGCFRSKMVEELQTLCSRVQDNLSGKMHDSNAKVHGKTLNSILKVASNLRQINIMDDEQSNQLLDQLEKFVINSKQQDQKNVEELHNQLGDLMALATGLVTEALDELEDESFNDGVTL